MPPRKKKASAVLDADIVDDDKAFINDGSDDAPKKKRKAPKKATPAKIKPIEEPHIALEGPKWNLVPPHLMYREAGPKAGEKIAAFDFDGTLVQSKSNADFAISADDWKLYNDEVPKVLKQYSEDGYKVVIFSNQGGIGRQLDGKRSLTLRERAEQALAKIDVPATIMYATGMGKEGASDPHRKPQTGMWDHFVEHLNGGVVPDKAQCFFVGDMAGRAGDAGKNPGSDRKFAENVGIAFKTPEEVFGERDTASGGGSAPTGPNADLVAAFEQLADASQQAGENMFKVRAFRASARAIAEQGEKITSAAQLKGVKGIGKGSMAIVTEFLQTGTLAALDLLGGVRKPGQDAPAVKPSGDAAMALKFL